MPKFIKGLSIIILLVLVVLSLVLADVFKIAVEVGYYSKRIEMQYNTWLAVGGCILAIIIATPMYILGYVLSLLGAIQVSAAETAKSSTACAALLAEIKALEKPLLPRTEERLSGKENAATYKIDRSAYAISCPACGFAQKSDRNVCFECGAVFVHDDETANLASETVSS